MTTGQTEKETTRVEAFSDGVFAIAITLLILEVSVPRPSELKSPLWEALLHEWHSYSAFLLSFLSILIMWFNHHILFNFIRKSNNVFLFLNGWLLMMVTIVPWQTAVLAEFWGADPPDERTAAKVYTGLMVMLAFAFNAVWRYAVYKGRLIGHDVDMKEVNKITNQYSYGPIMYALSFAVAFYNATAAILICMGLAMFFAFTGCFNVRPVLMKKNHS
jgi:uncharacterized membrane protein